MATLIADPADFITANLSLRPVPAVPEVMLYTAHEKSGLSRLHRLQPARQESPPPYWAHPWAGGIVLARHILDHPEIVAGKSVLDFGAGSGLVAIAAMHAGAHAVTASEIDPFGQSAIALNAAANQVNVHINMDVIFDLSELALPCVDVMVLGDMFYKQALADAVLPLIRRCHNSGVLVLIGDPGRAFLPRDALRVIAEYTVPDFGSFAASAGQSGGVFVLAE